MASRARTLPFGTLKLTVAEAQCLILRCEGKGITEIGEQLAISHRTVESHLFNAQQRNKGCNNGYKLVAEFVRCNVITEALATVRVHRSISTEAVIDVVEKDLHTLWSSK